MEVSGDDRQVWGVWKYRVMGKYEGVWKYRVQISKWVIMVAMSAQVYHELPHHLDNDLGYHLDHDLVDQLSLFLYLEWAAYKLEWMTPEV